MRSRLYSQPEVAFREILRGGSYTFALQVLGLVSGFFAQIMLARWLGVTEYGRLNVGLGFVATLSVLASQGLPQAALRFIPQYKATGQWELLKSYLINCVKRLLAGGGGIAVAGVLFFFFALGFDSPIAQISASGMALVVLFALGGLTTEALRGLGCVVWAFAPHQLFTPVGWGLGIAGAVALGLAPRAETALAVFYLVVITCLFGQIYVLTRAFPNRSSVATSFDPGWFQVSKALFVSTLVMAVLDQSGVIFLGLFHTPEEAGVFSGAAKISGLGGLVLAAVNALAAPKYAALHSKKYIREMQELARLLAHLTFWPSLLLAAVVFLTSPILLRFLGADFLAGVPLIALMLVGQLFNAATGSVGYLADLAGLHRKAARIRGYCAIFGLPVALQLIHMWGALGAALAASLVMVAWNIGLYLLVTRQLGVRPAIWDALMRNPRR